MTQHAYPSHSLAGCSESEDGPGGAAEGRPAEVSLEEALVRLAEFLSVQLGAEESFGNSADLSKVSRVEISRATCSVFSGLLISIHTPVSSPPGPILFHLDFYFFPSLVMFPHC